MAKLQDLETSVSYQTETKTHQVTFTQNCYETYKQILVSGLGCHFLVHKNCEFDTLEDGMLNVTPLDEWRNCKSASWHRGPSIKNGASVAFWMCMLGAILHAQLRMAGSSSCVRSNILARSPSQCWSWAKQQDTHNCNLGLCFSHWVTKCGYQIHFFALQSWFAKLGNQHNRM